ncbi:MAG: hypothetical protein V7K48_23435 [Nostoc sp.]|uniref:hypothetical protein n=1 Tax=Nostoc sp. TaxID=1180 RepID=UPI002FFA3FFA
MVAKKLGDATRSHQFTRLQTIPSIVTLFKTFSFFLGGGYPTGETSRERVSIAKAPTLSNF